MKTKTPLINKSYSKKNQSLILEQYKLIVESADRITERRQNTNKFYLGINSFIFTAASYLTAIKINIIPLLISLIGFLVSLVWYQNINSFRQLNCAKFKVIHELEKNLPANIYKKEDEYLQIGYYKLTSVEKWVPFIFGIIYIGIILVILAQYCTSN